MLTMCKTLKKQILITAQQYVQEKFVFEKEVFEVKL